MACWGEYLDVTGMERQEAAEEWITSSIEMFMLHKIIVGWTEQEGWNRREMQLLGEKSWVHYTI